MRACFPAHQNEDPQLDFYTVYRGEDDAEHAQKHDEGFNNPHFRTILFPSGLPGYQPHSQACLFYLPAPPSLSMSYQSSTPTLPKDPKHAYKRFSSALTDPFPQRKPRCSSTAEWTSLWDHHNIGSSMRESPDVASGRISCDARKAVAEPLP